ncbi:DUF4878 domain-containing protein [Tsukamurella sp. PLM1]|uniref:Rv0361 family membrane protein n=1 Tax=Tsukamurella sp. PLM1 TaxID=2929795 RepID=UPI00206B3A7B|nr:DUF4878 domain-containing protein [Tsukamurella sp. PLM1]BDH55503.1 hypothetical protein MTP03_04420 [Tsukamurella sp. PLM1]
MSADKSPGDVSPGRGTTATPFLIALVIAVLAIGGILTWNAIRPSEERLSDSAQVQVTIGQYYGALNKGRYADYVANTCAKDRAAADFPQEAGFADARKAVVDREGEAKLDEGDVKNLTVHGDTASAELTVTYEKAGERTEQATFVREDGKWKKCS